MAVRTCGWTESDRMKRVAYLVNQYPKVSHSFIRREILALERLGLPVARYALRGWTEALVDRDDLAEQAKTTYLLRQGVLGLIPSLCMQALRTPVAFAGALRLAYRMSRGSERPFPYHLVYLAEACLLLACLRRDPVDHLHAHFGTNSAEVVMLARVLGGPRYSFTVHGPDEFDQPLGFHLKEKIERAAFVVAISSYGRSQLFRWVGHEHWHKIRVVHCGIDSAFFEETDQVSMPEAPRLVCVGRLCEQKGQLLLIEAARHLASTGQPFELVLAGDGEMRSEIEDLIARSGLTKQVRITGWISSQQVRDELLNARVMVLPSFAEGLPVVIMESMALGRPVLSTTVAGIPELVRHGVDGWLIAPGDVDVLIERLREVLTIGTEQLELMGKQARSRAIERHSIDVEAVKLLGLFGESGQ
jgi:colanic acid/amylovoran biosynthesis glycosyltransferase